MTKNRLCWHRRSGLGYTEFNTAPASNQRGFYYGRDPTMDTQQLREQRHEGLAQIMRTV